MSRSFSEHPSFGRFHLIVDDLTTDSSEPLAAAGMIQVADPGAEMAILQKCGVLRELELSLHEPPEMFRAPNGGFWVNLKANKCRSLEEARGRQEVEIFLIERASDQSAHALLGSVFGPALRLGSCFEADELLVDPTTGSQMSVNGRLLLDVDMMKACRELYDDDARALARSNEGAVPPLTRQALRQGLWLERMSIDALAPFTSSVLGGVIIGQYEIDVLAKLMGQTVLVECKDTSLGQRDYAVTIAKAKRVRADIVLLISTQPFHANVVATIQADADHADYHMESHPAVFWIDTHRADEIKSQIADLSDLISQNVFKNWLRGDGDMSAVSESFFT